MTYDEVAEKPKKISGYYRYDVEDAGRTLRKSEEIKADAKFLKVVLKEMDKEAAKTEKTANLIRKTSSKLKEVFGGTTSKKA